MVNFMLPSNVVDHGFKLWSGQNKRCKLVFVTFSLLKHSAVRSKIKDWLAPNKDKVSECSEIYLQTDFVSVNYHYKNPTKSWSSTNRTSYHLIITYYHHDIAEK